MAQAPPGPASTPNARMRALWIAFEREILLLQNVMTHKMFASHEVADRKYNAIPEASRPSLAQLAEQKDAETKKIEQEHYKKVANIWAERLKGAGLTANMWTDKTPDEKERTLHALGPEFGAEGNSAFLNVASISPPTLQYVPHHVQAPSLSPAARGANASNASWRSTASSASAASYALVKPSEIYSEEDDDAYFAPHNSSAPHSEPASPAASYHSAHASASDNDGDYDDDDESGTGRRDPFAPWVSEDSTRPAWNSHSRRTTLTNAYPYASASAGGSTSASAAASVASLASLSQHSPQIQQTQNHHNHANEYNQHDLSSHTHGQRTASSSSASSAHSQSHSRASSHSHLAPRVAQPYIGPSLLTADEGDDGAGGEEEANALYGGSEADAAAAAAFDRFKLRTRMRMIVEFHAAAAAAEIKLAAEIWRVRRGLPASVSSGESKTNGERNGKAKADRDSTPRKVPMTKKGKTRGGFFGDDHQTPSTHAIQSEDEDTDENAAPSTPAALVVAHQSAMGTLQAEKEEERRRLVRAERDRRRADMRAADKAKGTNEEKGAQKGKPAVKDERRKGRSGTLISGQPAAAAKAAAKQAPSPAAADEAEGEEPWLAAAWRAAHPESAANDDTGRGGGEALAEALGGRFELNQILGGDSERGVERFLDGVLPPAQRGWGAQQQTQQQHHAQLQSQQGGWGAHNQQQAQQTPTAATFSSHAHRRRASTSASASAAASASASASAAASANTNAGANSSSRPLHAPIPVRPFGETSASSSDDEGAFGRRWAEAGQGGGQVHKAATNNSYPRAQPAFPPAPPLHALQRELEPDLMAAFVEYSGIGGDAAAGAVTFGGQNISTGSSSSNGSNAYNSSSSGHSYGAPPLGNSITANSSSSSMFGANSNSNNPYGSPSPYDTANGYGLGRGGPNAFMSAAEALLHATAGTAPETFSPPFGGQSTAAPARGRSAATMEQQQRWEEAARPPMHSRGASSSGGGFASAARSRSRSPTMTRGLPSWAARMTGGGQAGQEQQLSQQQAQHQQQSPPLKEAPARGPTATPVASGWTRKFQKPATGTGTPQPPAATPASSMFSLKNAFGFADDSEPVPPSAAPVSMTGSSWLGGKGKKAAVQSPPPPPAVSAFGAREAQHEPEVSLWEQVTQQNAKAGLVVQGAAQSVNKKAMPSVPSPPPVPDKAMDTTATAAGKKLNKKQLQAAMKKGGGFFEKSAVPEAEPEPEPTPAPPSVAANGKGKFAFQSAIPDEDADDDADAMFASPPAARGQPISTARRRLDSFSSPNGWDTEAGTASTPRPAPKIPVHLQSLAAAMSTPPPFGLKPLLNGTAHSQPQLDRPGTGMGMNSSTIRARGAAAVGGNAAPAAQGSGGGPARSLWGIFGGGSADTTTKQQTQAESWSVPGAYGDAADEGEDDARNVGDGGGGDEDGDDDWTAIAKTPAQAQKTQAPLSLAQRLGRGSEAAAPSPAPRAAGKVTAPSAPAPAAKAVPSPALKKAVGKKGAKGKKVMIEDVPDEETDNRGETLPVDSRHIFDDAEPSAIITPKPSVPPATYDTIISYTDEENDPKPTPTSAAADAWGDDAWMEAGAKETKEPASKPTSTGGGAWGADTSASKPASAPIVSPAKEEPEEPSPPPVPAPAAKKGGTQQKASSKGGKRKGR